MIVRYNWIWFGDYLTLRYEVLTLAIHMTKLSKPKRGISSFCLDRAVKMSFTYINLLYFDDLL